MVRLGTKKDIRLLADLAAKPLHEQSRHPGKFDREAWIQGWSALLDSGAAVLFVSESGGDLAGAVGALFFPDMVTGGLKAAELFYYVLPDFRGRLHGGRLYVELEAEARRRGASVLVMSHLSDNDSAETLRRFYLGKGFARIEEVYAKEL